MPHGPDASSRIGTPISVVNLAARSEARAHLTAWYALVLSIMGHVAQIAFFAWFDRPGLSLLNLLSVLVLGFALWLLVTRRAVETTWWIAIGELLINNLVTTAMLGVEAGFLAYPLIGIGVGSTIPFCPVRRRLAGLIVGFAILFVSVVAIRAAGPINPFDAVVTSRLLVTHLTYMAIGITVVLWFYAQEIARAEQDLAHEYERSEGLLVAILPAPIAARLKSGETIIADDYRETTVLFADIVGFTEQAAQMPADELVRLLDRLFSRFDALAEQAGVEKIKTIGDAYMAVAGLPTPRADHADAAVRLALNMLAVAAESATPGGAALRLRIGVHSGPLTGGVIGQKRMTFDLWGDVVNTASRMESTGEPGRVQISEATYRLLGGGFRATERGSVDIKGKGIMRTWFVDAAPEDGAANEL